MRSEDRSIHASENDETEQMAEIVKDRFSEIFLATSYATKNDRIYALLQCFEEETEYTIKELQEEYQKKYNIPISRVAINSYVNQLEAEGKVKFERRGLGGSKIVTLV